MSGADPGRGPADRPTDRAPAGGDPQDWAAEGVPSSAQPSPANRLAAASRRLAELLVGRPIDDDALESAATQVAAVADALDGAAVDGKRQRFGGDRVGHAQDNFPTSPVIGFGNPLAPPAKVWAVVGEDGRRELRGRVRFGYAYEGPPTCAHGGVIAETFDELLGLANIVTGRAGMTGTLTVRYRAPTPLLAALDLVARQTTIEGRKIRAWGGIFHQGALTAEAEGIFIELGPERMLGIVVDNAAKADGEVADPQLAALAEMSRGGRMLSTGDQPAAEGEVDGEPAEPPVR